MARTFHRGERLGALSEINITPLIDLAFSLLIIFMITAPLLEQSIALELPVEEQDAQLPAPEDRFQTISINAEGLIFWEEEAVSEEQLERLLEDFASLPDPPVINIRGDKNLPYQSIVTVIDIVKRNHLTKISLDTSLK